MTGYCPHGIKVHTCSICGSGWTRRSPLARLLWTLGIVFLLAACKCTATPAPVPPDIGPPCAGSGCEPLFPDAGPPADEFTAACAAVAAAGCAEGSRPDCAAVMQHSVKITLVPTRCLAAAKTKDDVRDCGGFVKCR